MNLSQYEILIPFVGLCLLIVLAAMLVYALIIGMAFACSSDCAQMMLSDEWDKGYVLSLSKTCQQMNWTDQ